MRAKLRLLFLSVFAVACMGCDESQPSKKLVITIAGPLTLAVGDTSAFIRARKTTVDNTGRQTTFDYVDFTLVSADTNVVAEAGGKLVGKQVGQTTVTAQDNNESLISENKLSVTVVAPPQY